MEKWYGLGRISCHPNTIDILILKSICWYLTHFYWALILCKALHWTLEMYCWPRHVKYTWESMKLLWQTLFHKPLPWRTGQLRIYITESQGLWTWVPFRLLRKMLLQWISSIQFCFSWKRKGINHRLQIHTVSKNVYLLS